MSAAWSIAGGILLAAATVPQAVKLVRTRDVHGFAWAFITLNFVGILFLLVRSLEIREWPFVAINAITAAFWLLVIVLKAKPRRDVLA